MIAAINPLCPRNFLGNSALCHQNVLVITEIIDRKLVSLRILKYVRGEQKTKLAFLIMHGNKKWSSILYETSGYNSNKGRDAMKNEFIKKLSPFIIN